MRIVRHVDRLAVFIFFFFNIENAEKQRHVAHIATSRCKEDLVLVGFFSALVDQDSRCGNLKILPSARHIRMVSFTPNTPQHEKATHSIKALTRGEYFIISRS